MTAREAPRDAGTSRAWRWRAGAAALVLVLLVLPCLAARRALRRPPPRPPFAESSEGAATPAAENGWAVVEGSSVLVLYPSTAHIAHLYDAEATPEQLRAAAHDVATEHGEPALVDMPQTFDRARRLPRYADATPSSTIAEHAIHHLHFFEAAGIAALDDALAGRGTGLRAATDVLRMAYDFARTARTMLSTMVAVTGLDRALWVARMLAELALAGATPPDPADVDALRSEVTAVDVRTLSAARGIAGEEALFRSLVLAASSGTPSILPTGGLLDDPRLLDAHDTIARADAYFVAVHTYAGDPAHVARPPAPPDPTAPALWFLWNAPGKRALSLALTDLTPLVGRYETKRADVAASRRRALAALDALLPG